LAGAQKYLILDPYLRNVGTISGRIQNGEEEQEPEAFDKNALLFPSGEALPKCWFDSDYKLKQAN